jgi:hypothetical protein
VLGLASSSAGHAQPITHTHGSKPSTGLLQMSGEPVLVKSGASKGSITSPRPVSHRPPPPEACGLRYIPEYKVDILARNVILSAKGTLVGGQLSGVVSRSRSLLAVALGSKYVCPDDIRPQRMATTAALCSAETAACSSRFRAAGAHGSPLDFEAGFDNTHRKSPSWLV